MNSKSPTFSQVLLLSLLVSAPAALGYYWLSPRSTAAASPVLPAKAGEWHAVKRGEFEILCREEGELRPVKVTSMAFQRVGKISFMVPEGTYVKKGEKVVALETKELEEEVQHFQEDLATAERNLSQQEQTRDLDIKRLQTELLTERERAELARLKQREVLNKPLPLDKLEAQNLLDGAKARLANAEADLAAVEPLAVKGFGKGSDLAGKRLAVLKAQVELQRAEMKFRTTMAGALPEERLKAKLESEDGELGLKIKEILVSDQTDSLDAKVKTMQRAAALLQRKLERRQQDLDRSTLTAPHDGIAVYRVMEWRGNKKVEVGEMAGPWLSPIDLPNFEKMKVRTQVPESFIRQLRARSQNEGSASQEGSKARVIVKTLPDRIYSAEVTWIDGWARDRNSKLSEADIKAQGLSGVRVFDVEVELDQSDTQRLREGFRATVEFPVDVIKNVISLPVSAVTSQLGQPHIQVLNNGQPEWRKVELGTQSMDRVVVSSGLDEGEQVFVPRTLTQQKKPKVVEEEPAEKKPAPAANRSGGSNNWNPNAVDGGGPVGPGGMGRTGMGKRGGGGGEGPESEMPGSRRGKSRRSSR